MRKKILIAVAVLALSAAVAAAVWWQRKDRQEARDIVQLHGNVDIRQVDLAFNASERIVEIAVQEGDRVTKGQLLARLDTDRLRHAADQAAAQAAAQRQVVARLKAGSLPEEIRKARADVEAAQADAANAQRIYERDQDLVSEHFVSQQQADTSRAAAEAAAARLKAAREALRLVVRGPRKEDVAAAKATLAALEAAANLARRDLEEASLYAPADGVIEKRVLEPGDMASPQKTVFTLALTEPLWVRAYLSETDLGRVRLGSRAEIRTDSHPEKVHRGWVGFISPTAEFTPKSVETREVRTSLVYQVRVFVCGPAPELRLGMPATVDIRADQQPAENASPAQRCAGGG